MNFLNGKKPTEAEKLHQELESLRFQLKQEKKDASLTMLAT